MSYRRQIVTRLTKQGCCPWVLFTSLLFYESAQAQRVHVHS